MALARFLICERSSWQVTTSPVGICVIRTAESVVFTPCPPGPEERYTSTRMSFSSTLMSTSSASGRTATVTMEVCVRPLDSVSGTRCTRWTPRSNLSRLQAPRPWMKSTISLKPPTPVSCLSMSSTFHFCRSAYLGLGELAHLPVGLLGGHAASRLETAQELLVVLERLHD